MVDRHAIRAKFEQVWKERHLVDVPLRLAHQPPPPPQPSVAISDLCTFRSDAICWHCLKPQATDACQFCQRVRYCNTECKFKDAKQHSIMSVCLLLKKEEKQGAAAIIYYVLPKMEDLLEALALAWHLVAYERVHPHHLAYDKDDQPLFSWPVLGKFLRLEMPDALVPFLEVGLSPQFYADSVPKKFHALATQPSHNRNLDLLLDLGGLHLKLPASGNFDNITWQRERLVILPPAAVAADAAIAAAGAADDAPDDYDELPPLGDKDDGDYKLGDSDEDEGDYKSNDGRSVLSIQGPVVVDRQSVRAELEHIYQDRKLSEVKVPLLLADSPAGWPPLPVISDPPPPRAMFTSHRVCWGCGQRESLVGCPQCGGDGVTYCAGCYQERVYLKALHAEVCKAADTLCGQRSRKDVRWVVPRRDDPLEMLALAWHLARKGDAHPNHLVTTQAADPEQHELLLSWQILGRVNLLHGERPALLVPFFELGFDPRLFAATINSPCVHATADAWSAEHLNLLLDYGGQDLSLPTAEHWNVAWQEERRRPAFSPRLHDKSLRAEASEPHEDGKEAWVPVLQALSDGLGVSWPAITPVCMVRDPREGMSLAAADDQLRERRRVEQIELLLRAMGMTGITIEPVCEKGASAVVDRRAIREQLETAEDGAGGYFCAIEAKDPSRPLHSWDPNVSEALMSRQVCWFCQKPHATIRCGMSCYSPVRYCSLDHLEQDQKQQRHSEVCHRKVPGSSDLRGREHILPWRDDTLQMLGMAWVLITRDGVHPHHILYRRSVSGAAQFLLTLASIGDFLIQSGKPETIIPFLEVGLSPQFVLNLAPEGVHAQHAKYARLLDVLLDYGGMDLRFPSEAPALAAIDRRAMCAKFQAVAISSWRWTKFQDKNHCLPLYSWDQKSFELLDASRQLCWFCQKPNATIRCDYAQCTSPVRYCSSEHQKQDRKRQHDSICHTKSVASHQDGERVIPWREDTMETLAIAWDLIQSEGVHPHHILYGRKEEQHFFLTLASVGDFLQRTTPELILPFLEVGLSPQFFLNHVPVDAHAQHAKYARLLDVLLDFGGATLHFPAAPPEPQDKKGKKKRKKERKQKKDSGVAPPVAEQPDQTICTICMDQKRWGVFVPCGHLICCQTCGDVVKQCPQCRVAIQLFMRVFQ